MNCEQTPSETQTRRGNTQVKRHGGNCEANIKTCNTPKHGAAPLRGNQNRTVANITPII